MNSWLQWVAGAALGRMLFCLAEGTALALLVACGVRLLPKKNSRTRFIVWFSALLAVAVLPLFLDSVKLHDISPAALRSGAVTLPVSVATYIFVAWLLLALTGMARIIAGIWGVRRAKANAREIPGDVLSPELLAEVERCRKWRGIRLLVSAHVQVPTAMGFFKPAIILPEWLVQESSEDDVRHVVLHELAHLRRHDDWTNLLQKFIKALLFFHPAVWWMERNVSLDREMACDDEVLEKAASPHDYAASLARVAEKSFLRRQIALAQAAVGRVRQLSLRVARILDPKRPAAARAWRPAAPAVAALALVAGMGLSWVPGMVNVESPAGNRSAQVNEESVSAAIPSHGFRAQVKQAKLSDSDSEGMNYYHAAELRQTSAVPGKADVRFARASTKRRKQSPAIEAKDKTTQRTVAKNSQTGFVLLVATQQTFTATPSGWRMSIVETRWVVPAKLLHKQNPNKT